MNDRLTQIAARGAARMQRLSQRIQGEYQNPDSIVTQAEAQQHKDTYGHYYDQNCTAPFCNKWRRLVDGAMAAVKGGSQ